VRQRYLYTSVPFVLLGALVFYSNYDIETIQVTPNLDERPLLNYSTPEQDPLPHHILVKVNTTGLIQITYTTNGESQTIFTDDGSGKFHVYPTETIFIEFKNPTRVTGTVKTTFYRDSWNYTAYVLFAVGTLCCVLWLRKTDESCGKEI
jgi:hypothetical protein